MMISEADIPAKAGLDPEQRGALPPFALLRAFEAIGTCGGIRRAAEALSIDHAAISRHLRALESWAGAELVDRRPGAGRALTEEGQRYHQAIARGLGLIASAGLDLTRRGKEQQFVLLCAPGLASEWLSGRLGDFSDLHPGLDLEIRPCDETPGPATYGADAQIYYAIDAHKPAPDDELRVQELVRPAVVAVASPERAADLGPIARPQDLLRAPLLHETNFEQWRRWFAQHGVLAGPGLSGPKFWQAHLALAAAKHGKGVALANSLLVKDALARGELVEIGGWPPVHLGSYLFVTRRSRWSSAIPAGFRRWLERQITAP
jgi:LysR family glycine cleavage system transcriptional activator